MLPTRKLVGFVSKTIIDLCWVHRRKSYILYSSIVVIVTGGLLSPNYVQVVCSRVIVASYRSFYILELMYIPPTGEAQEKDQEEECFRFTKVTHW